MSIRSITPNDPANFTPTLGDYKELKPFRFWCQKVLPLVYDDSLSYYELLCKVVDFLNKTMEDVETLEGDVTNLHTAYKQLQDYVNNYFSTLDVQKEINNKLDEMAKDGTLTTALSYYAQRTYKNVEEMCNDTQLKVGMNCKTLGYYSENDGGGTSYLILENEETLTIKTKNGYAINLNTEINVLEFGVKQDTDCTDTLQDLINKCYNTAKYVIYFPKGKYLISKPLLLYYSYTDFWNKKGIKIIGEDCGNTYIEKTNESEYNNVDTIFYIKEYNSDKDGTGVEIKNFTLTNKYGYCVNGLGYARSTFKNLTLYGLYGIYCKEGYSNIYDDIIGFTKETCLYCAETSNNILKVGAFGSHNPFVFNSIYSNIDVVFGDNCTGSLITSNCWGSYNINSIGSESPNLKYLINAENNDNFAENRNINVNNISCFNLTQYNSAIINLKSSNITVNNITILFNAELSENMYIVNFQNQLSRASIGNIGYISNVTTWDKNKTKLHSEMKDGNIFNIRGYENNYSERFDGVEFIGTPQYGTWTHESDYFKHKAIMCNCYYNNGFKSLKNNADITYNVAPSNGSLILLDASKNIYPVVGAMPTNSENGGKTFENTSVVFIPYIRYAADASKNPKGGEMWFDTENSVLKIYSGGTWKTI